jgi:hypothetical protein
VNSDPLKNDFRTFLSVVWSFLQLKEPTKTQLDIASYLAIGPKRRIVQAFRGVGKSWITAAYVLWRLHCDSELKILVVSASKQAADNFSTFCLQLINGMPELHHLRPRAGQRDSKINFDVGPARESKDPSVRSVGITGQLTGSRADLIVPDDVETPSNSQTQQQRDKLSELVKEFDAILKPGGDIVYLGTPQTEASLYSALQTRGYSTRIWPARYPHPDDAIKTYGHRMSPRVTKAIEADPRLIGQTVEPGRFSNEDLAMREASYGRSGFALQFMLDTTLSDALRYPLKLSDLMVMDLDPDRAPDTLVWGNDPAGVWDVLPSVGLTGDRYYRPIFVSKDTYAPYTGSVMTIDPSGRGKDELGFCVTKMSHGRIFCVALGGLQGGYEDANLTFLAELAKKHKVNLILIESNFGDGMFTQLLKPVMGRVYPCTVEEIHHTGQKELRIIDTLEPVLNQHRLIVDRKVIQLDFQTAQDHYGDRGTQYQAFYQMSRITKDRRSLAHEDRLEALAMGVAYWVDSMARDSVKASSELKDQLFDLQLKHFMKSVTETLTGRYEVETNLTWSSARP